MARKYLSKCLPVAKCDNSARFRKFWQSRIAFSLFALPWLALFIACGGGGLARVNSSHSADDSSANQNGASSTDAPSNWEFRKTTETSGATSYICESDLHPPLSLDGNAAMTDFRQLNAVLAKLDLPAVDRGAPDAGEASGSRWLRGQYHWDDYPLGKLVVTRHICETRSAGKYDAIWKITIQKREESDL